MLRLDSVVFVSSPVELPRLPLAMNTEFSAGTSVRAMSPASWTEPSPPGGGGGIGCLRGANRCGRPEVAGHVAVEKDALVGVEPDDRADEVQDERAPLDR